MADVETEQNAPLASAQDAESSGASIAICEDNLAALLRGVSDPVSLSQVPSEPSPAATEPVSEDAQPADHANQPHVLSTRESPVEASTEERPEAPPHESPASDAPLDERPALILPDVVLTADLTGTAVEQAVEVAGEVTPTAQEMTPPAAEVIQATAEVTSDAPRVTTVTPEVILDAPVEQKTGAAAESTVVVAIEPTIEPEQKPAIQKPVEVVIVPEMESLGEEKSEPAGHAEPVPASTGESAIAQTERERELNPEASIHTKLHDTQPPDAKSADAQSPGSPVPVPETVAVEQPRHEVPAPEPRPAVSKLALLSSIKQRHAVSSRPESRTQESDRTQPQAGDTAEKSDAKPEAKSETPAAANSAAIPASIPEDPSSIATPPAPKETVSTETASAEQSSSGDHSAAPLFTEKTSPHPEAEAFRRSINPNGETRAETKTAPARPASPAAPSKRLGTHSAPPTETLYITTTTLGAKPPRKPRSFGIVEMAIVLIAVFALTAALTAWLLVYDPSRTGSGAIVTNSAAVKSSPNGELPAIPAQAGVAPGAVVSSKKAPEGLPQRSASPASSPATGNQRTPGRTDEANTAKNGSKSEPPLERPGASAPESDSPRTAARAFTPPQESADGRAVTRPVVDAPPALGATASEPAPAVGALPAGVASLPPPPSPAPAPSAPAAAQPRQISVAANAQAGKLVRRVTPAYPALARATRVQGTVRFRATIAADGQIKGLVTLGGPIPLQQPAADAVKQWRYQPTLVNGQPVEVVTEIDVAFTL